MPDSPYVRSFLKDAMDWHRTDSEAVLVRLIRSPCSGVPHDVGAAYATLTSRTTSLLDAIDRGQLALPASARESLLRFARRLRRLRELAPSIEEKLLKAAISEAFELGRPAEYTAGIAEEDQTAEIALTPALLPEQPTAVAGWQKHFSASALNMFSECARRWFYKYACAAVEDQGSAASAYGSAFHLALEDFHGEYPRPKSSDEAAMRRRIKDCVRWAFERNRDGFETMVAFELALRRAQRTAARYIDWLLVQEREAPFEVIGREVAAEVELEGRPFVGYIDRLDRDERSGGVRVVDYKTGSIASDATAYAEQVRKFRDFQLPLYYWARTAAGEHVTHLVLIPLRDALLEVRPVVMKVGENISLRDLQRSRAKMLDLSKVLASGSISTFEPTEDSSVCAYCAYAPACTKRPPAEAVRFGS